MGDGSDGSWTGRMGQMTSGSGMWGPMGRSCTSGPTGPKIREFFKHCKFAMGSKYP